MKVYDFPPLQPGDEVERSLVDLPDDYDWSLTVTPTNRVFDTTLRPKS